MLTLVVLLLPACALDGDGQTPGQSPAVTGTPVPDPASEVTNGVDARPADTVLQQAIANLSGLRSYRVTGSPTRGDPLDLTFASGSVLSRPGTSASGGEPLGRGVRGTLTRDGSTFEILAVDGAVYVRGDLEWLADVVSADARRTVGKKWLLLPAQAAARLETFTDPAAFARAVLDPGGEVQAQGVTEIGGRPALGILSLETGGTAWVAGTGAVLPVQVEREGATGTDGVLVFGAVDRRVTLAPPPASQVVAIDDQSGTPRDAVREDSAARADAAASPRATAPARP
jgi:hypothetical protein